MRDLPAARAMRVAFGLAAPSVLALALAGCGPGSAPTDAGSPGFATCPGFSLPPGAVPCRDDDDCPATAAFCIRPGEFAGCGVVPACERLCETDPECTDPTAPVCVEDLSGCNQACFTPPTVCVESCVFAGCPMGEQCDDPSGHCGPIPCELGWACPPSSICDSGFFTADEHGCVRRACDADAECDCGTCVFGVCYELPGTCMPPAA